GPRVAGENIPRLALPDVHAPARQLVHRHQDRIVALALRGVRYRAHLPGALVFELVLRRQAIEKGEAARLALHDLKLRGAVRQRPRPVRRRAVPRTGSRRGRSWPSLQSPSPPPPPPLPPP